MKTALIVVTLAELLVLVLVLAVYLISIAATLRTVARTLGLVTFGVRAIEKQTQPLGQLLGEVNGALEQVAAVLGGVAKDTVPERTVDAVEHAEPFHQESTAGS